MRRVKLQPDIPVCGHSCICRNPSLYIHWPIIFKLGQVGALQNSRYLNIGCQLAISPTEEEAMATTVDGRLTACQGLFSCSLVNDGEGRFLAGGSEGHCVVASWSYG